MRIGIFGGTFNPIHMGHIRIAEYFRDVLSLDEVLIIPSNIPPHKEAPNLVSGDDRYYMCKLAAAGKARLFVSEIEIMREGASRTMQTIEALKEEYPGDSFYLIMGSDVFLTFDEWYRYEEIMDEVTLCTVPRHADEQEALFAYGRKLQDLGAAVFVGDLSAEEVSSTEVRETLLETGASTKIDSRVQAYISCMGLYRAEVTDLLKPHRTVLERHLGATRIQHSLNVAKAAVYLALLYGAEPEKALNAGVYHDLMKETASSEMLQIAKKSGIIFSDIESMLPVVWHGKIAAAFLKLEGLITDEAVLEAISLHTVPKKGMTLLDKVVYLADVIALDRKYGNVWEIRALADDSLEEALHEPYAYNIERLLKRKLPILEGSVDAYNENVMCLMERERNLSGKA